MPPRCPECGAYAYPHTLAGHRGGRGGGLCGLGLLGMLAIATHGPGWHRLWMLRLIYLLTPEGDAAVHRASLGPEVS